MNQYLLLVLGFVLTTVFGGLLGYFFQERSWEHQHRVTGDAARRDAAFEIFQELSTLMDKRLYRMRVFDDALCNARATDKEVESAREEYRQVRYEWNDNLNRNLARVEAYFGMHCRSTVEEGVFSEFSRLHAQLRKNYEERGNQREVLNLSSDLRKASGVIYMANLSMLQVICATWDAPDRHRWYRRLRR